MFFHSKIRMKKLFSAFLGVQLLRGVTDLEQQSRPSSCAPNIIETFAETELVVTDITSVLYLSILLASAWLLT